MSRFGIEVKFGTPTPGNVTPLAQHRTHDVVEVVRYARPVGAAALRLSPRLDFAVRRVPATAKPRPRARSVPRARPAGRQDLGANAFRSRDRDRPQRRVLRLALSPLAVQRQRPFVVLERGRPIAACALERVGRRLCVIDLLAPRRAWSSALTAIAASANDCDTVELKLTRADANTRDMWRRGFVARNAKVLNVMLPEGSPHEAVLYFDGTRCSTLGPNPTSTTTRDEGDRDEDRWAFTAPARGTCRTAHRGGHASQDAAAIASMIGARMSRSSPA